MEWCCSLDRTTNEGVMKRPDRGAKSYVGGVASSRVPKGRKDRGQGRSSRDRTRAIHIRMLMGGRSVPATTEKHLIRSLFATCASLAIFEIRDRSSLPPITYPPRSRVSVFPSVADKTSFAFPFQNFSSESPPSDPLQIQIYFLQRLSTQSPSSPS